MDFLYKCSLEGPPSPVPSLLPGETVRFVRHLLQPGGWGEQTPGNISYSQAGGSFTAVVSVLPCKHPGSTDHGGHFGLSLFSGTPHFPILTSFLPLHCEKELQLEGTAYG